MMGAGKSTVGRALAARQGRRFVDADAEIERRAGARIPEIFASRGETGFRALEREVAGELAGRDAVVALGGGAIVQAGVREALAAAGPIVYLRARPETLLARVGDAGDRPLLAGLDDETRLARLRELLAERETAYAGADLCIDTDGMTPDAVAEGIEQALATHGRREVAGA
jgi:shikimate kinase